MPSTGAYSTPAAAIVSRPASMTGRRPTVSMMRPRKGRDAMAPSPKAPTAMPTSRSPPSERARHQPGQRGHDGAQRDEARECRERDAGEDAPGLRDRPRHGPKRTASPAVCRATLPSAVRPGAPSEVGRRRSRHLRRLRGRRHRLRELGLAHPAGQGAARPRRVGARPAAARHGHRLAASRCRCPGPSSRASARAARSPRRPCWRAPGWWSRRPATRSAWRPWPRACSCSASGSAPGTSR